MLCSAILNLKMVSKSQPSRADRDADINLSSSNSAQVSNRSSREPPSNHFMHGNPAQTVTNFKLPIRLPPYPPQLAALDAEHKCKHSQILNNRNDLMPRSLVFDRADEEEERSIGPGRHSKQEMLDKTFADRTPYVQLASRRLQAVLGTRNEHVFELPSVRESSGSITTSLKLENLYDIPDGSAWGKRIGGSNSSGAFEDKNDKCKRPEKRTSAHLESHHSAIPDVDKVTGAGLREFLRSKGRACGESQRRCASITISALTPDARTCGFADTVLGKWEGALEKGERVEVHEIELPSTSVNILTGEETAESERWIWFLISCPVLGLLSEKGCKLRDGISTSTSGMSSDWYKPALKRGSSSFEKAGDSPRAPPNFPHPIPNSWIVFACPKAHVTCYPETTETLQDNSSHFASPDLSMTSQGQSQNQKICHRTDYDLSHFGIPIFEFSSPQLFDGRRIEFSSVNGMEGWDAKDAYLPYSKDRYELEQEHVGLFSKRQQNEYGEDQGIDPPCPNHGDWWHKFYEEMYKDARRWKEIKHAMGRGKCRVSIQWDEPECNTTRSAGTKDEDIKDADRLRRDNGLGISGAVAHARKKSRSSIGKEKVAVGKHRATRSETRRRSSLGLEILLASSSDDPSGGFERAAVKGQMKERLLGNRKSAPVVRSGLF